MVASTRVVAVISGGQSGVDRAALNAAISCAVPIDGYVPKGWVTEDGNADVWRTKYPELHEMDSVDYPSRTRKNIDTADATLIIMGSESLNQHAGSRLTYQSALRMGKPVFVSDLHDHDEVVAWIRGLGTDTVRLNVAGPRASRAHGIYTDAFVFVVDVLTSINR
jgi:hypothetical protein